MAPHAPVRAGREQRLQGRVHDLGHPIVVVRSRATRTLLIVQSFDPLLRVAFAPLHHRVLAQLQPLGDGGARLPVRATEHDLGALYQPMGQGAGAGQTAQIGTLLFIQDDRGRGAGHDVLLG